MRHDVKGQIFSADFIISIGLYVFILTLSLFIWNTINMQIEESETNNVFYSNLISISDILIETPGTPSDWEKLDPQKDMDKINQIGLALSRNVLSTEKIIALTKLPYTTVKNILGVRSRFIYIEFLDTDGKLLADNGQELKFGSIPKNSGNTYTIIRPVVIESKKEQKIDTPENPMGSVEIIKKQTLGHMKVVMG